ncbi:MAG: GntR family transcriptional regulator [Chitinivibrionales bacterium]|nr:GntR family transcriptional regulator [Chitinivibrionales bacterium]
MSSSTLSGEAGVAGLTGLRVAMTVLLWVYGSQPQYTERLRAPRNWKGVYHLYSEYMTRRQRSTRPSDCARDTIRRAARRARRDGVLLPPIDSLAAEAGVSRMTAWHVLLELCDAGELVRLEGRRGFAVPGSQAHARTPGTSRDTRCDAVAAAIIEDLVTGRFDAREPLPPYKTLTQRYGACYSVVRTALDGLVARGTLVRYKRGYRLFPLRPRHSGSSVAVIAGTTDMRELCSVGTRTTELWRSLERETMRIGLPVTFLRALPGNRLRAGDGATFTSIAAAERALNALGHIVLPLGMNPRQRLEFPALVDAAQSPVAVLEESRETLPSLHDHSRRNVVPFALGFGRLPGYIVGKRLLELGHRSVAFLCLSERDIAFGERLAGMRTAFAELGIADGVQAVTSPRWRAGVEVLHRPIVDSPALKLLNDAAAAAERISQSTSRRPVPRGEMRRALGDAHRVCIRKRHFEIEAQELFARALKHDSVTAWVTINDEFALMALRFLRRRRIAVPDRLSVVGFDDSVEAFGAGLSSYNFNVAGVVRAMLEHLVARRPPTGVRRSERGIEVPGSLVQRRSLAPTGAGPD